MVNQSALTVSVVFGFLVLANLGCRSDIEPYSLKEVAPLHVDLRLQHSPKFSFLEGEIHTSMPYLTGGCALDVPSISLSVNGLDAEPLVLGGGHGDGECLPALFIEIVSLRPPKDGAIDVLRIQDHTLEVKLESEQLLERRFWKVVGSDFIRNGERLEGQWSHAGDALTGAISRIRYLVDGGLGDPEEAAFIVSSDEIDIDGSSFYFTIPEVTNESTGILELEIENLPVDISCANATCAASLHGVFHSSSVVISP